MPYHWGPLPTQFCLKISLENITKNFPLFDDPIFFQLLLQNFFFKLTPTFFYPPLFLTFSMKMFQNYHNFFYSLPFFMLKKKGGVKKIIKKAEKKVAVKIIFHQNSLKKFWMAKKIGIVSIFCKLIVNQSFVQKDGLYILYIPWLCKLL